MPANVIVYDASAKGDFFYFEKRVHPNPNDIAQVATAAILATKNSTVHKWNNSVLRRVRGPMHTLTSANTVNNEPGQWTVAPHQRSMHFDLLSDSQSLQSDHPSGMPLHFLNVKVGAVCLLLRNLRPLERLMNGTKFVIVRIVSARLLECERIDFDGQLTGHRFLLPRISLTYTLPKTGIEILRRQFPLTLAYAMTTNKSQGQSLTRGGIDLRDAAFTHGQMFVAWSRFRDPRNVVVLLPQKEPRSFENVVFRSLLERPRRQQQSPLQQKPPQREPHHVQINDDENEDE